MDAVIVIGIISNFGIIVIAPAWKCAVGSVCEANTKRIAGTGRLVGELCGPKKNR